MDSTSSPCIVRVIKIVTAVFFAVAVLGVDTCASKSAAADEAAAPTPVFGQEEVGVNEPAAYYGFGEIEIIKLDWGIHNLRVAEFNGDGRNDIAIVNNRKAKIEVLVQEETVGPGEAEVAVDPEDIDVNLLNPPTRFDRQAVAVSQKVYSLVCGDLDSDGMTDLAFYGEPKGLYVILQADSAKAALAATAGEADTPASDRRGATLYSINMDTSLLTGVTQGSIVPLTGWGHLSINSRASLIKISPVISPRHVWVI